MRRFVVVPLVAAVVSNAGHVHAEGVAAAPSYGIDPDEKAALDEATRAVDRRDPASAARLVIDLHASGDRFVTAQKPLLVPPSVSLLRRSAALELGTGNLEGAAVAYDAAWILDGKRDDPEYARTLVQWADLKWSEDKGEALYLVRRARLVDPANEEAASRDSSYSRNRLAWLGWTLEGIAVVAVAGGLVARNLAVSVTDELNSGVHSRADGDALLQKRSFYGTASIAALSTCAVAAVAGIAILLLGKPTHTPTSPASLPALSENR